VPISFTNPLLAWGALAAAIPVIVHLIQRRRPRPHPFAALELVRRSQKRNVRRLRLKRLLLLAARTLLLLLVPLALARPRFETAATAAAEAPRGPAATAIVLDTSLSMGWSEGKETLLDRARDDARDVLANLSGEEPVTVVRCDGAPPVAGTPGFDRAAARRQIDDAELSLRPADLSACVAAAARALGESQLPGKRIYVATDLTAAGWRLDAPPATVPTENGEVLPEVVVLDAARGRAMPNVAITDLSIEPAPEVGPRGQAFVFTVRNFGDEAVSDVEAQLVVGDEVVAKGFVEVPARGAVTKKLAHRFPAGGTFVGSVRLRPDALALDDRRDFTVHVPRDLRALVVDGDPSPVRYRDEAFFVEAALRMGGASPLAVRTVDAESLPAESLDGYDLVLLLNVRAPDPDVAERLHAFVSRGGGLFVALGENVESDAWNERLGPLLPRPLHLIKTAAERGREDQRPARFGDLDLRHPVLRVFSGTTQDGFRAARIWRYFLLQPGVEGDGSHVLATWDDGAPALVERAVGEGRVLLYTSTADRDWSDWAIQSSFLPTVQQAAGWLARALEERQPADLAVGAIHRIRPGEGVRVEKVVGPDGRERPVEVQEGELQVGPLDRPGAWRVIGPDDRAIDDLAFTVRLDPVESDTRRLQPAELQAHLGGEHSAVEQSPVAERKQQTPIWSILAALAIAAFCAEGALIRR